MALYDDKEKYFLKWLKEEWNTTFDTFFQYAKRDELKIIVSINDAVAVKHNGKKPLKFFRNIDAWLIIKPDSFKDSNYVWDKDHLDIVAIKNIIFIPQAPCILANTSTQYIIKTLSKKEIKANELFVNLETKEMFERKYRDSIRKENESSRRSNNTHLPYEKLIVPGATWGNVSIVFVRGGDEITIKINGKEQTYHFSVLGFPNSTGTDASGKLRKYIQKIRAILKELTGIDDDPFKYNKRTKTYETKFAIRDSDPSTYEIS